MKRIKWKQCLIAVSFMSALAGSLLAPIAVQASEATSTSEEAAVTQNAKNVTKKITKKNPDITMEVSCGIDGVALYDMPLQMQVTVKSNKDFSGYVRVVPQKDYGEKAIAYGEDISLAAGASKTFSFGITSLSNDGRFSVALLDDKDKVIYSEIDTVSLEGGDSVYVGVLSEDYSGLTYFDAAKVDFAGYEQQVNLLELTSENFPEDSSTMNFLEYLLIDNFDTAQLSQKQYTALKNWVKEGGVLLVSLGSNYQNVLHCFEDDFLTGTLGSVKKKNLSFFVEKEDVNEELGKENFSSKESEDTQDEDTVEENPKKEDQDTKCADITVENVDTIEFTLNDGTVLDTFSNDNTVYKKAMGSGAVVVLSFDLGMEPFASLPERKEIVTALLEEAASGLTADRMMGNYNYYNYYNTSDIAKNMDESKKPSTLLFGIVLVVYVVFVGPVLYMILKKRKKQEKIWIAIPITAFICTMLIFFLSTIYRVRKPLVNTFTVIQPGEGSKEEKIYTNIICPKAKDYSFILGEDFSNVKAQENYSYSMFSSDDQNKDGNSYDMIVKKQNNGVELRIHNSAAFQEKNIISNRISENELGTIDLDIHCYTTGFEGTITNHMYCDLTNVVVNFENYFYVIDSLKIGESAKIEDSQLIKLQSYDYFADIVSGNIYGAMQMDKKKRRQYQINQFMENVYVQRNIYNQGCVWADVGSYTPDMIKDDSVKQYGGAVVYFPFAAEYEDAGANYCPDIELAVISSDGDYDSVERCIYGGVLTQNYSFEDYSGVTELVNLNYDKKQGGSEYNYASIYAYNVKTGNYDVIFKDSDTIKGEELKKYLDGNIMILRYESSSDGASAYLPHIIAKGDE